MQRTRREQSFQIRSEEDVLHSTAEAPERGRERNVVHHLGPVLRREKPVLVPERGERSADLLIEGASSSVTLLVIVQTTPKCRARHVTVSPSPITPVVTPPIARSPDTAMDSTCALMSSAAENTAERGAAIAVITVKVGIHPD